MLTIIKLIDTSITLHSYYFLCVVRTLKIYCLLHVPFKSYFITKFLIFNFQSIYPQLIVLISKSIQENVENFCSKIFLNTSCRWSHSKSFFNYSKSLRNKRIILCIDYDLSLLVSFLATCSSHNYFLAPVSCVPTI